MSVMNKVLGAQVLTDVQTFVAAFDTLFGGFRERAEKTVALLREPHTAFLVVAAPQNDALREASYFTERLREEKMPLAGVVLNRVTTTHAPDLSAERSLAAAEKLESRRRSRALTAAVLRLHADRMQQVVSDHKRADRFRRGHRSIADRRRPGPARRRPRPDRPPRDRRPAHRLTLRCRTGSSISPSANAGAARE